MTGDLVLRKLSDLAITELKEIANRENEEVQRVFYQAVTGIVEHGICAGEALIAIRAQTPAGQWCAWLDENFNASVFTARIYMRFASHKDELIARDARTYEDALGIVKEIAAAGKLSPEDNLARRQAAHEMSNTGQSYREIGKQIGVDPTTVQRWLKPMAIRRSRANKKVSTRDELERLIALVDDALLIARRMDASQYGFRAAVRTLQVISDALQRRLSSVQEAAWISRCDCARPLMNDGECARCGKPARPVAS